MPNSNGVAYNPNDPLQAGFLVALSHGETGGSGNPYSVGVGGSDLSAAATDAFGFPQWTGQGNSHAAGAYQFQPSTWDSIASEFDLNFQNPNDQNAGAWYLAQQADPTLESDLQAGNYSKIQSALKSIWPSVTGNAAAPRGLAANLSGSVSAGETLAANQTAANNASGATSSGSSGSSGGVISSFETWVATPFIRIALLVVGAVIIFVALWMLLSNQGIIPSPSETAKAAIAA